jgi:hypothetical protein
MRYVFNYAWRGHTADFSSYAEDECGYRAISVYAFESLERTTGGSTSFEGAYIDYYDYDSAAASRATASRSSTAPASRSIACRARVWTYRRR